MKFVRLFFILVNGLHIGRFEIGNNNYKVLKFVTWPQTRFGSFY